jgi:arylsulfatase A-like enzyme
MTGKYPGRLHITHAIPIEGYLRMKDTLMRDADYVKNMPLEEVTIAEALKEGGYATAFMGKWHCCWEKAFYPEHQGFDLNIGGNNMGSPGNYFSPYEGRWRMTEKDPWVPNNTLPAGQPGEYLTDRLTVEAIKYIAGRRNQPFFLCRAHYAVHTPLRAKKDKIAAYEAKPTDKVRGHTNATYAAMIEG